MDFRDRDNVYLKELDLNRNKIYFVKISILDRNERVIKTIEGRTQQGSSISINGNSNVRRTCNLTVIADPYQNDLTDIDNFLSINKKIKIAAGIQALGQDEELTWFPLGVYVITNPSITHSANGVLISLQCKDKMCLLNGELGGNFPTSITFHEYNATVRKIDLGSDDLPLIGQKNAVYYTTKYQGPDPSYIPDDPDEDIPQIPIPAHWDEMVGWTFDWNYEKLIGTIVEVPQLIFDIIQTVMINYGKEDTNKIIINDVPKEIKQLVRYTGSAPLYFNTQTGQYTTDEKYTIASQSSNWKIYEFNDDVGYTYTDFTYPGSLITNIGDNICTVLDKIKNILGNFEYFYDIDGNFVFQEIKNYLNTNFRTSSSETTVNSDDPIYLETIGGGSSAENFKNIQIVGDRNYRSDYCADQKSIYRFDEGSGLIVSYSNTPSFTNVKNDYHIWGKTQSGTAIHYHLAIKEKPKEFKWREVEFLRESTPPYKFNGKIKYIRTLEDISDDELNELLEEYNDYREDRTRLIIPNDWRAELYLQGLEIQTSGGRPDIYIQEILDFFNDIYEWSFYDTDSIWGEKIEGEPYIRSYVGRFKNDFILKPNNLKYFIDYLEPVDNLYGMAVDDIDTKIYSYQQDKIVRLYDCEVPNYIILNAGMDKNSLYFYMDKCDALGQPHSLVDEAIYKHLSIGTIGYSAEEVAKECLYKYSTYNESITLQSIPIYYLDVNRRITVKDKVSGINGDYVIQSITLPIAPVSTMNITATRALQRI